MRGHIYYKRDNMSIMNMVGVISYDVIKSDIVVAGRILLENKNDTLFK